MTFKNGFHRCVCPDFVTGITSPSRRTQMYSSSVVFDFGESAHQQQQLQAPSERKCRMPKGSMAHVREREQRVGFLKRFLFPLPFGCRPSESQRVSLTLCGGEMGGPSPNPSTHPPTVCVCVTHLGSRARAAQNGKIEQKGALFCTLPNTHTQSNH